MKIILLFSALAASAHAQYWVSSSSQLRLEHIADLFVELRTAERPVPIRRLSIQWGRIHGQAVPRGT
jgi:hypothetical protein